MTAADRLLSDLKASADEAYRIYRAACDDDSVSAARFTILARQWASADARLDGAREMMRAMICDEGGAS